MLKRVDDHGNRYVTIHRYEYVCIRNIGFSLLGSAKKKELNFQRRDAPVVDIELAEGRLLG